jgi:hypothetical protein
MLALALAGMLALALALKLELALAFALALALALAIAGCTTTTKKHFYCRFETVAEPPELVQLKCPSRTLKGSNTFKSE